MARTKDFTLQYAIKKESASWGTTSSTTGADDQKLLDELKIEEGTEVYNNNSKNGLLTYNGVETSAYMPSFSGNGKFYTLGMDEIIDNVFTASQTPISDTTFSAVDPEGNEGNFLKFGVKYGPSDLLANWAVINELKISGAPKEPLTIDFSGVARDIERKSTSRESDSWSIATEEQESLYHFRHVSDLEIDGTAVKVKSFGLTINQGYITDDVTQGSDYREQPLDGGELSVTFECEIYKHESDAWNTSLDSNSEHNIKVVLTRGTDIKSIYLPAVQLVQDPEIDTSGSGSIKLNFKALNYDVIDDPFEVERTVGVDGTYSIDKAYPVYMITGQ